MRRPRKKKRMCCCIIGTEYVEIFKDVIVAALFVMSDLSSILLLIVFVTQLQPVFFFFSYNVSNLLTAKQCRSAIQTPFLTFQCFW